MANLEDTWQLSLEGNITDRTDGTDKADRTDRTDRTDMIEI